MKLLNSIVTVIGVWLLASCEPAVVFGEPQPVGAASLLHIPDDYQGMYWCSVDSAALYIDDKAFVRRKEFLIKTTKEEIMADPDLDLVNGDLLVKDWEGFFPITQKGDTLTTQIIVRDTIFAIERNQIAKTFKGHLVLNLKLNENSWEVLVVSQRGQGLLAIAQAKLPENLSELDSVTPIRTFSKTDSLQTQIYLKPTAQEFERIYEKGLLFDGSCTEYQRIYPLRELIY